MTESSRVTTREAAAILKCKPAEALVLLRAAGVPHTRMGSRGPILWQSGAVKRLLAALAEQGRSESQGVGP